MAMTSGWLIDKSALWKLRQSPEYTMWVDRINRGLVAACITTRLEIAVSAIDSARWPNLRHSLLDPLLDAPTGLRSERIALEMMEALMSRRLHRSVPVPDVLIASVAAAERLTVLHDDRDFERIRDAYGEPDVERLRLG
ncbi:MAG: VapC toxin family PIN domain ribonuclease [Pseudonocardia sp.]|nr:VapC toxin family PIN domain ribonuclease [Pseudonocardia sp.]